jgi:hypothetical protein
MESEFGALIDEPSLSRSEPRHRQTSDFGKQRARVAVDEGAVTAFAAGGAAVGEDQIDDQQRMETVQRVLVGLEAAFFEDYGLRPDTSSRTGFECFMRYNPAAMQPLLGAESNGRLVATWESSKGCLSIRFMDRYHFQYAITATTERGPSRRWGTSHALTFFDEHPEAKRLASS